MLSDTEGDLPRLEAEYQSALARVDQLETRIRRLRKLREQRYSKEFFQWLGKEKGGQHGE